MPTITSENQHPFLERIQSAPFFQYLSPWHDILANAPLEYSEMLLAYITQPVHQWTLSLKEPSQILQGHTLLDNEPCTLVCVAWPTKHSSTPLVWCCSIVDRKIIETHTELYPTIVVQCGNNKYTLNSASPYKLYLQNPQTHNLPPFVYKTLNETTTLLVENTPQVIHVPAYNVGPWTARVAATCSPPEIQNNPRFFPRTDVLLCYFHPDHGTLPPLRLQLTSNFFTATDSEIQKALETLRTAFMNFLKQCQQIAYHAANNRLGPPTISYGTVSTSGLSALLSFSTDTAPYASLGVRVVLNQLQSAYPPSTLVVEHYLAGAPFDQLRRSKTDSFSVDVNTPLDQSFSAQVFLNDVLPLFKQHVIMSLAC